MVDTVSPIAHINMKADALGSFATKNSPGVDDCVQATSPIHYPHEKRPRLIYFTQTLGRVIVSLSHSTYVIKHIAFESLQKMHRFLQDFFATFFPELPVVFSKPYPFQSQPSVNKKVEYEWPAIRKSFPTPIHKLSCLPSKNGSVLSSPIKTVVEVSARTLNCNIQNVTAACEAYTAPSTPPKAVAASNTSIINIDDIGIVSNEFGAGIANIGNSCYMNSLLQALRFSPSFRKALKDEKLQNMDLAKKINRIFDVLEGRQLSDQEVANFRDLLLDADKCQLNKLFPKEVDKFLKKIGHHTKDAERVQLTQREVRKIRKVLAGIHVDEKQTPYLTPRELELFHKIPENVLNTYKLSPTQRKRFAAIPKAGMPSAFPKLTKTDIVKIRKILADKVGSEKQVLSEKEMTEFRELTFAYGFIPRRRDGQPDPESQQDPTELCSILLDTLGFAAFPYSLTKSNREIVEDNQPSANRKAFDIPYNKFDNGGNMQELLLPLSFEEATSIQELITSNFVKEIIEKKELVINYCSDVFEEQYASEAGKNEIIGHLKNNNPAFDLNQLRETVKNDLLKFYSCSLPTPERIELGVKSKIQELLADCIITPNNIELFKKYSDKDTAILQKALQLKNNSCEIKGTTDPVKGTTVSVKETIYLDAKKLPHCLPIQLKRYRDEAKSLLKNTAPVTPSPVIYVPLKDRPNTSVKYKLTSIVCHDGGSISNGHYRAFVPRYVDKKELVVGFSDCASKIYSDPELVKDTIEKQGCLFFYENTGKIFKA